MAQSKQPQWEQDYAVALKIADPWHRCRALSEIARSVPAPQRKKFNSQQHRVLSQAIQAAFRCHDENRRVHSAAVVLRVAIAEKFEQLANRLLHRCIEELRRDQHPISRWSAAVSVIAAIKYDRTLMHTFVPVFIELTQEGHGWRIERCLRLQIRDPVYQQWTQLHQHLVRRQQEIQAWKAAHRSARSTSQLPPDPDSG